VADIWIEKKILERGYKAIAGVDEVGRGALFGPVVAASVILPFSDMKEGLKEGLEEIKDSKLLSPLKRKRLAKIILTHASCIGLGLATNHEIDQRNIYWASLLAMRRAIENMSLRPDFLLVDGFCLNGVHYPQLGLPKGDKKSITIAAASIVAKVLRDGMMIRLDKFYQGYALSKNKGYGTREHYKALKKMGPTVFHRMSFNLKH